MSSNLIDEQIKQLQLKKKKIEFLEHILKSATEYEDPDFRDVKEDVVLLLGQFVISKIEEIQSGSKVVSTPVTLSNNGTFSTEDKVPLPPQPNRAPAEPPPNVKMNFALDNRHLSGKSVSVMNDKSVTIKGTVVGLDAPNVIVKTEAGPVIKVPLNEISLN